MTFKELMQGIERPDVLDKEFNTEYPWIKFRITNIETLIELVNGKPSDYTAGGIAVKIVVGI